MCLIRNPKNGKANNATQTEPHHPSIVFSPTFPLKGKKSKNRSLPLMKHQQIYLFNSVMIRSKKLGALSKHKYQIQMGINFTGFPPRKHQKISCENWKGVKCAVNYETIVELFNCCYLFYSLASSSSSRFKTLKCIIFLVRVSETLFQK